MWKVDLWEYERGWGSKIDETLDFPSFKEAKNYQVEFNSKNTDPIVPDWYMTASEPYEVK